jgi:acyl carrier protein
MRAMVTELVYGAIDELNTMLLKEQRLEKSANTILFGPKAKIDSMDFITFLVALEGKIQGEFGFQISLDDEKAFTSPFRTVSSLIDHICLLTGENDVE